MTRKKRWNIWRIKSCWLRAPFTLLLITPVLIGAVIITALIALAVAAGEFVSTAYRVFIGNWDVKFIARNYWRAITLRSAP